MKEDWIQRIAQKLKQPAYLIALPMLVWMLFFDDSSISTHWRLSKQEDDLREQLEYFDQEVTRLKKEKDGLSSNPRQIEQVMREQYLMQQEGEDLYLVVPEDSVQEVMEVE